MAEQGAVESNEQAQPQRARVIAERARTRATELWRSASTALRKPAIGAGVAGATVLAAGALWGVTEAALAGVAAWAVYRTLRKRGDRPATPPPAPATETG